MGPKKVVNTFTDGMNKDIDKSLVSNKSYLDALNFRLITTEGGTSGALENVKGNKQLSALLDNGHTLTVGKTYSVYGDTITHNSVEYDPGDQFVAVVTTFTGSGYVIEKVREDQIIIGGVEIRDKVILFTTSNTGATPSGGRSCIYEMEIDLEDEELVEDSLDVLYDDNLNAGTGSDTLNFSSYYPIKAVSRYESSNTQKIYWTDGYNNLRYADIAKNLTIDGSVYSSNNYMSTDKFELQPNFDYEKPFVSSVITGFLAPGVVQYAYQLYRINGAETTLSPLSDVFHITNSGDTETHDYYYKGSSDETNSGKGCRVEITNTNNTGFDRARLIRVHYSTLNSTPSVSIVAEVEIPTDGSSFYVDDTGYDVSILTTSEVTVADTSLFSCQDIAVKNDILFAANINTDTFDVGDFDSRAVRFNTYEEDSDVTSNLQVDHGVSGVTIEWFDEDTVFITIPNFTTFYSISGSRTVTDVTGCNASGNLINGVSTPSGSFAGTYSNVTGISFDGTDLEFYWNATGNMWSSGPSGLETITAATITSIRWDYDYYSYSATPYAKVQDVNEGEATIDNVFTGWSDKTSSTYLITHDGINQYNDPDNDYDFSKSYKYQSDGSTLGAEGPNVTVGFTTEGFMLDDDSVTTDAYYYSLLDGSATNPSYESYSSPWMSGRRSFQRSEVYRLYAVYYDAAGRSSFPQWICDLKMPGMAESGDYELTYSSSSDTYGRALYPTVNFDSLPTGTQSFQIYVVPRGAVDRSIYTQGYAQPFDTNTPSEPKTAGTVLESTKALFKLLSPEVMINENVELNAEDYIEFIGEYSSGTDTDTDYQIRKFKIMSTSSVAGDSDDVTDIDGSLMVSPTGGSYTYDISGTTFINYDNSREAYGCSGLMIKVDSSSWNAFDSPIYVAVNLRRNVFNSQYGGNTYEARANNYCRPCSEILTNTSTTYTCKGGDTFINYFDVMSQIFNLDYGSGFSDHESVLIPVESSINCDLRYDTSASKHFLPSETTNWFLMQETSGEHEDDDARTFNQETAPYLYNTVYSQEQTLGYKYCAPESWVEITDFDTQIKNSQTKINGELSDSWTSFLTNDFIDVDSSYGPVNAIHTFNNNLYYFQDTGIGVASVNPRSLIQDNTGTDLVLGTGGVLDRYDYVSQKIGSSDKFSITKSKTGLYWYDALTKSIFTTNGSNLANLSKAKYIYSYLDNNVDSTYSVRSAHDTSNDEILFTFMKSSTSDSFTIGYNEIAGVFSSFYSFIPTVYIPFQSILLSTTTSTYSGVTDSEEYLWVHNSDDVDRCQFYALYTDDSGSHYDSTVKVLFNPEYTFTKVFDNLEILTNVYSSGTTEVYNKTFDEIRCYDDYQNTDTWNLTYDGTYNSTTKILPYQRRERSYNTFVPRNAVDTAITSNPDIFNAGNLDTTGTYKDRMRDKYLVTDLIFENDGTYGKLVFSSLGLTYRTSYR